MRFDAIPFAIEQSVFLKIIRFVVKEANMFVISHKGGMEEKFDKCLKFEKVKGFSYCR